MSSSARITTITAPLERDRITLSDHRLAHVTLASMPRVARLRARQLEAKAEICIERAKLITEYMTELADAHAPAAIVVARRVRHYLSRRQAIFRDDNLLAGSTTSKQLGAPIYPELLGLSIWPELDTISARATTPQRLSAAEIETLNLEVFPYWIDETVIEILRARLGKPPPLCLRLLEKLTFYACGKVGGVSHCVPRHERVLHEGMDALIAEAQARELDIELSRELGDADAEAQVVFYQAAQLALRGAIEHATALASKARALARAATDGTTRREYEALAEVCSRVPAKPARSFREALNSLWLNQIALHAENANLGLSPGRLDQVLWPFYQRDVAAGRLTPAQAVELCCCLWLKLTDNTALMTETAELLGGGVGSTPALTLGGVDGHGRDAVNDLTYVLLRTAELMALPAPVVNARYCFDVNDLRYRDRLVEVIVNADASVAIHSDVADIETLINQGQRPEHARDYAIVGRAALVSSGRDYAAASAITLNLAQAVDLTLFQGKTSRGPEQIGPYTPDPREFSGYEDFWAAFATQLRAQIERAIEINELLSRVHQDLLPTPLLSTLFEGPLALGRDLLRGGAVYNSSGATHVAFPEVCDSLNAIEVAVFRDGRATMAELIEAVRSDFAPPYTQLRDDLVHNMPRLGTGDPVALRNSNRLLDLIYDVYQSHTNYRGGPYRPAYWTTSHVSHGELFGALPSGRRARRPFNPGITPTIAATPGGTGALHELLDALASFDSRSIPGGAAVELELGPPRPGEDRRLYLERFATLVEDYFRQGGMQAQFHLRAQPSRPHCDLETGAVISRLPWSSERRR
ncbi:Benzylsuccinate synthase alpha subunit [Enhygromyxa salina]|uniref:Benzylsuccinate synthase alpha subunit n=1 Tax=Enhygromyxa salina TaxID=215803 RepID=A0A2S9XMF3_9BACT|nr:pyruvate formate lyase family protein [Enhygromyxa salina]PRP94035.1 Benzylsuccinate synthase alpha subunit [Enhygromyxa salina]